MSSPRHARRAGHSHPHVRAAPVDTLPGPLHPGARRRVAAPPEDTEMPAPLPAGPYRVVESPDAGAVPYYVIPFDADTADDASRWIVLVVLAIHVSLVLIVLLKAKLVTGLAGMFVPFVALVGAVRLAKPHSPWARFFYPAGSTRRLRAEARQRRHDERWASRTKRVLDAIGGTPNAPETD